MSSEALVEGEKEKVGHRVGHGLHVVQKTNELQRMEVLIGPSRAILERECTYIRQSIC
jgi:hypothetical protein